MPGFTGKVGQPQTPHHHPDDLTTELSAHDRGHHVHGLHDHRIHGSG